MEVTTLSFRIWATLHVCICLFALISVASEDSTDVLLGGQSLRDSENQTMVSRSKIFEFGFFTPAASRSSNKRYLGMWYYNDTTPKPIVWVANRNAPLPDTSGVLTLTPTGMLVLLNSKNLTIWSSPPSKAYTNPKLELEDSGNLVLGNGWIYPWWQSFDDPCDTLLPGMMLKIDYKTGKRTFLTSWKTAQNPGQGQFSLAIEPGSPGSFPQLMMKNGTANRFRLGPWNEFYFTNSPLPPHLSNYIYRLQIDYGDASYSYYVINSRGADMFVLNQSGFIEHYIRRLPSLSDVPTKWLVSSVTEYNLPCDQYGACGANMVCQGTKEINCVCMEGFKLISAQTNESNRGCVRTVPLTCEDSDFFLNYTMMKLPVTTLASWSDDIDDTAECQEACLNNCSCTAYAYPSISVNLRGCLMWNGDLFDMSQSYPYGDQIFIRMSVIPEPQRPPSFYPKEQERQLPKPGFGGKKLIILVASLAVLAGLVGIGVVVLWCQKRKRLGMRGDDCEMDVHLFDRATIMKATDNFSAANRLGQGGFGPVFKGTLTDGQEIAVKTLSKSSGQGVREFTNEVLLIAKVQHRNLVKLLGCCVQGDEKMLVYELMANKSLDYFIFDKTKSKSLDWNMRMAIINGIARGLLYLHQDSRLRIIHRDLKVSNVLLDEDMNPKISDFGLARAFSGDQLEDNTTKVVGTFGYMSPEYAMSGLFSMKSDVFSFGVLMLEIISGEKNRGFSHEDHNLNLLGHAWRLWDEERPIELVEEGIMDREPSTITHVSRCVEVGLQCVQQRPDDRPSMSSVVVMLTSETPLPRPKQPGFFAERNFDDSAPVNDLAHNPASVNEVTISELNGR